MTETRFYEPARLSTLPKPLFSLKPLDVNLVEVIVIREGLPAVAYLWRVIRVKIKKEHPSL